MLALAALGAGLLLASWLRGDVALAIAAKSIVKALAWPFGLCLWCPGRESGEGILHLFLGGLGHFGAVWLPLLVYGALGLVLRRYEEKQADSFGHVPARKARGRWVTSVFLGLGALVAMAALSRGPRPDSAPQAKEAQESAPSTPPRLPTINEVLGAPAEDRFVVQVGAFEDIVRANQVASKLTGGGHRAFLTEHSGRHRVRVGPFPTREAAEAAALEVRKLSFPAAILELGP